MEIEMFQGHLFSQKSKEGSKRLQNDAIINVEAV